MNTTHNQIDLLVEQKDNIISLLIGEKYELAVDLLTFITPLWLANDYGYKLKEISYRISFELFPKWSALSGRSKTEKEKIMSLIKRADLIHSIVP
jgi:hypothetical protein